MATKTAPKAKTAGRDVPAPRQEARVEDDRHVLRTRSGRPINMDLANPENQFEFDRSIIPDGWDYEWKTETVANAPWTQHQVNLSQAGWEPVPAERHDGLFLPLGMTGPIRRGGMLLMERPMEATRISKMRDKRKADAQVGDAFARAGMAVPKTITDFDHPDAKRKSGVRVETTGFATQSGPEFGGAGYTYEADE